MRTARDPAGAPMSLAAAVATVDDAAVVDGTGAAAWWLQWVALPAVVTAAYLANEASGWLPTVSRERSEHGSVEIATLVLLALAAWLAAAIARDRRAGRVVRTLFGAYAAGAVLVALEEASWGQHLFGWSTPEWFLARNSQGETNLHNLLSNVPNQLIRSVAYNGLPLLLAAAPLLAGARRGAYPPRSWRRRLLPRFELVVLSLLPLVVILPKKLPESMVPARLRHANLREYQELLWAWTLAGYPLVIRARSREDFGSGATGSSQAEG